MGVWQGAFEEYACYLPDIRWLRRQIDDSAPSGEDQRRSFDFFVSKERSQLRSG